MDTKRLQLIEKLKELSDFVKSDEYELLSDEEKRAAVEKLEAAHAEVFSSK